MFGNHTIRKWSSTQATIALSSGEAEYYSLIKAAAQGAGVQAMLDDLGIGLDLDLASDSSAALGISQRAGIGKVRHLRTQGLWVQECRVMGRLSYRKVLGAKNPADLLTKRVL